jgi:hypothetical protein
MVISPTALADFERCPRLFHFRHGLKLPDDAFGVEPSLSGASKRGTVAHSVLEQLHFETATEEEIRRLTDQVGISAGVSPSERLMIVADLVRFASSDIAGAPAAREMPFFCHPGESLYIRGQIDALIEQGNSVIVRDYKHARAADQIDRYQVQMEAYALAVADAYPHLNVRAEIVFLRDEGGSTPVRLPSLPEIRARILALGNAIKTALGVGDFPRKPPGASVCRRMGCGFVGRCWAERT